MFPSGSTMNGILSRAFMRIQGLRMWSRTLHTWGLHRVGWFECKSLGLIVGLTAIGWQGGSSKHCTIHTTACASTNSWQAVMIEKPETHTRDYEFIELPNKLRVILASDPTCDKAAAALCLNVGKLHEPKHLPGLAHFCEHMLFLGTEQFPVEGEYKNFLKKHGGGCNASTSDLYTCYHFAVSPDHLVEALDRFSQFFISPLFTASAVEREINAVDSEHSMRITDDLRRTLAILLLSANPAHPWHWGSGNSNSLRDAPKALGLDLHKEVLEFFQSRYSSNGMTLAVVGKQSLSELRRIVEERFSRIKNKNLVWEKGDAIGGSEPPILPEDFPCLIHYTPSKNKNKLTFQWQLPWQTAFWRTKPTFYVTQMLGHEGEGSVLSALKRLGWATDMSVGTSSFFGCMSLLEADVKLTPLGMENVKGVGVLIFTYIRLLQRTPIPDWVFEEKKRLNMIKFRFESDRQPVSLAKQIVHNLQHYPPEATFSGPALLHAFDKDAVSQVLLGLTLDKLRVEIWGKQFVDICVERDPWYGGCHHKGALKESWYEAWSAVTSADQIDDVAAQSGLRLPTPNCFVAENLDLLPLEGHNPKPCLLHSAPRTDQMTRILKVFFKQDDKFYQPKAMLAFRFHSPYIAANPLNLVRCKMWCRAVDEKLNEYAYDAEVAGLRYSLTVESGGLELRVNGFNDKLPQLLEAVVQTMHTMSTVDTNTFALTHDRLERRLKDLAFKEKPHQQTYRRMRELLFNLSVPLHEQLDTLQILKVNDLNSVNSEIFNHCHIDALMQGNLSSGNAAALTDCACRVLNADSRSCEVPLHGEAALPEGHTIWKMNGTDPNERNHALRCSLQIRKSEENVVKTRLLAQILSAAFFQELRTEQQLGYVVSLRPSVQEAFVYVNCIVQSEFPLDFVQGRIEAFLIKKLDWIESPEGLSEDEFSTHCQGMLSKLKHQPTNLPEEFEENWSEVASRRFDFDRRERYQHLVEVCGLPEFRAFARDCIRTAPRLYVQIKSLVARGDEQFPDEGSPLGRGSLVRRWEGSIDSCQEARNFRKEAKWIAADLGASL